MPRKPKADPVASAQELQEQLWSWLEVTVPAATDGRVILGALLHQMAWILAANSLEHSLADRERTYCFVDEELRRQVEVIRAQLIQ